MPGKYLFRARPQVRCCFLFREKAWFSANRIRNWTC